MLKWFHSQRRRNESNNHPNEAQIASGRGPNLLKHQNTREWRAAEIHRIGQGCVSGIAKLYSLVVTDEESKKF